MTETSIEKEQTASIVTPEGTEDNGAGEEPFLEYETLHVDRWLGGVCRRRRAREPVDFHFDASGLNVANARASGAVFTVVARVQVIAVDEAKDRRGDSSASGSDYYTSDEDMYRKRQRRSRRKRRDRRESPVPDPYITDRPFILPPKPRIDYQIEIASKSLIQAINLIIKQGDDINMRDDVLEVRAPYASLMYHHASLKEYQDRHQPNTITDSSCAIAADMHSHLELLLSFLGEPTPLLKAEITGPARVEFDDLWQLFSPGTPILRSVRAQRPASTARHDPLLGLINPGAPQGLHGNKQSTSPQLVNADFADGTAADHFAFTGAVVKRCYVPDDTSLVPFGMKLDKLWAVDSQGLSYNGNTIITTEHTDYFDGYDGAMEIKDLIAFPLVYADPVQDGLSAMQHLVNRGKSYRELQGLHCKWHDGAVSRYPHYRLEGLVQIDQASCLEQHPELHEQPPLIIPQPHRSGKPKPKKRRAEILCPCAHCTADLKRKESKLLSRIRNAATKADDAALEECLFTFPAHTTVYVFKTREWTPVYINNLSEPEFREDMIDTLVMDDKRRRMLQALSRRFVQHGGKSQTSDTWGADFVKGKGANFCTLCHGPPGVGKTYTAECIAQYTKRPLITLTSGDIGVDPLYVQDALTKAFTQSKRWNAILLIDEADIYLERRSLQDLTRNSLVASFLRALDFYEGILFLTTNRVGSFDDAFISRIHVKLHYPPLSNEDRLKIWNNFIDKLKRERKSSMRVMREVYKYISSSEVNDLKLNGREIRNIWQTAVTLAEHEADKDDDGLIKITDDHVHQVVSVTGDFKVYLDDLHVGDEEQRAARRNARNDDQAAV